MNDNLDLASERRLYEAGIRPSAEIALALLDRIKYLEGQTRRNYQDWQIAYGRAEAAEAVVQRVREKHFPDENGDCDFCVNYYCDTRKAEYPCPTIRTLDGGEQE